MKPDPIRTKALELSVEFWAAVVRGDRQFNTNIGMNCIIEYAQQFETFLKTKGDQ